MKIQKIKDDNLERFEPYSKLIKVEIENRADEDLIKKMLVNIDKFDLIPVLVNNHEFSIEEAGEIDGFILEIIRSL